MSFSDMREEKVAAGKAWLKVAGTAGAFSVGLAAITGSIAMAIPVGTVGGIYAHAAAQAAKTNKRIKRSER